MGDHTEIEWTDATWNTMRGCSRTIAPGAETSGCGDPTGGGCYAERNGYRFAGPGLPYEGLVRMTPRGARWTGKVLLVDKHLLDPLRWERPRKIFTTSVSDPFHERFTNEAIAVVFGVMAATPRHTHQLLTKRVERMLDWYAWVERVSASENGGRGVSSAAYCFCLLQRYVADRTRFSNADRELVSRGDVVDAAFTAPWPLGNVWPMASVEHQPAADDRINRLLRVPGVVHGLSCEPLIGPIDLAGYLGALATCRGCTSGEATVGAASGDCDVCADRPAECKLPGVCWVVIGAESGPRARPALQTWIEAIVEQCAAAGVAVFVKQMVCDGKLRHDVNQFPPHLQRREFPR